ncbi:DNA mismatch repair protein MutL (plasmid) [Streptococcus dysgalactiae]|nr:DNA mismatch repair protein MutL [Streptococcus dysgalactiae]
MKSNQYFPNWIFWSDARHLSLLLQGKDGLFIIDQHAAQERVKYEYYRDKIGEVDQ